MNYTELTDDQLRDHLRQIETVLKVRNILRPIVPVILKVLLIVDDEFQILDLMEETFNIGYHVITATTVSLALKAAKARPPDIAIVDWALNGESGGELSWKLHEMYPKLPIIILSGHSVSQKDAINHGAKLAMLKPYSPMGLADVIKRLLEEVDNPANP